MSETIQKKTACGGRSVAALAMISCAMLAFAEPVKVGNPGFPYSVPGSFLTVCRCEKGRYMFNTYPGLWLRNVSTSWRENFCRLVPSVGGKDVEVTECVMRGGWLEAKTDKGAIEFAYLRPDVVLVRSKSPEMHIRFEYQFPRQKYDFPATFGRTIDYMHFNADRILMDTRVGVRDPDRGNTVRVHPSKDGIEVALLDIHTGDWDGNEVKGTFAEAVAREKASFERMYASLPSVPKEFEWARHEAAILFWTTIAGPRGMFRRPMMLMSNNWMNKTWSWDHAINSLSLGYHDQDAAWEQFRCMFDFITPEGMMPDMVSDEQIFWLAVKPPVHGWVFSKLRAMKKFPKDKLEIAYDLIGKWTNWWLTRRDFDHNGLAEYLDGCDSGWDNSTAICMNRPPLETPDLQAFLILQMECLADIAKTLGRDAEAVQWTARAQKMLDATVKILFDEDGTPRVRRLRDGGFDRDSLSLVTRLPMILGKRLPEKCRAKMIADIKTKGFVTDWGLASESVNSKHYHPDGYWKGPIWGPSTLIAVEGLRACGEDALADEISLKFCKLIMKSGFSENFDAKTGDARRDPAYTWTASAFLVLAHELESRRGVNVNNAVSLAGRWRFALGDTTKCTDSIMLPTTTDIAKKGDGRISGVEVEKIDPMRDDAAVQNRLTRHPTRRFPYVGLATYERDIEIPSAWAGCRIELFLERTKVVDAYLDGTRFGRSDTLAAPAVIELPRGTVPGRHTLRLVVDNRRGTVPITGHQTSDDTQTNWNGVMGRMEMMAYGEMSIVQVKTFPSAAEGKVTAKVVFRNDGARAREARVEMGVSVTQGQQAYNSKVVTRTFPHLVPCGVSTGEFAVVLGPDAPKWSEFNPVLHTLTVKAGEASATVKFGLRDFRTKGTQFTLNGRPMFLRGRHDACVWPLTGAAPMEVEPWRKYFATLKDYGLNHVRFHSWCPPEAAFEAADEAGFIMLPEFGVFGGNFAEDAKLRAYCLAESKRIIDAYGNHPSFAMFTLGNECRGGRKERTEIIRALRAHDPRPLYAIATNGDWNAPQLCEEDDFWATFRSCDGAEGNARGSYAHCNAPLGAVQLPGGGTMRDFSSAVRHSPIPVIGHETGQFQAYPDYSEIPKYTGVLKPINLEIFKARLEKAGLGKYASDFCRASGRLMAINYREDMEEAFRTPGFGGFQLLDLQDFPGQGTALVGVLNAFMESKGFITPERWRMSCSPTVLLARFPRYTYVSGEKFVADVQIAHYGQEDVLTGDLEWSIEPIGRTGIPPKRRKVVASGKTGIPPVRVGEVKTVDRIEVALPRLESQKHPARARWFELCLSFADGKVKNSYPIWVYPEDDGGTPDGVEIVRDLESADKALAEGRTALCILDKVKAPKKSVPGFFTTDFWNWEMFNGPARKRKVIAPGTLGLLVNEKHPALAGFPTSFHSDYQWRELIFNGVNVVLDGDNDADVIVRGIDNITRNQNLGVIWEKRRGKGRVLYCSLDLEAAKDLPEARALRRSLLDYMKHL